VGANVDDEAGDVAAVGDAFGVEESLVIDAWDSSASISMAVWTGADVVLAELLDTLTGTVLAVLSSRGETGCLPLPEVAAVSRTALAAGCSSARLLSLLSAATLPVDDSTSVGFCTGSLDLRTVDVGVS
jgi:hypothetical protein